MNNNRKQYLRLWSMLVKRRSTLRGFCTFPIIGIVKGRARVRGETVTPGTFDVIGQATENRIACHSPCNPRLQAPFSTQQRFPSINGRQAPHINTFISILPIWTSSPDGSSSSSVLSQTKLPSRVSRKGSMTTVSLPLLRCSRVLHDPFSPLRSILTR